MSKRTREEIRALLLAAKESGALDEAYRRAKAEHDELRAELEASMRPIDPDLLRKPMTI
jgi:hypothetical protein